MCEWIIVLTLLSVSLSVSQSVSYSTADLKKVALQYLKAISVAFFSRAITTFGGLWEEAVKSSKAHLKKVVGEQKLTYEELSTVLCRIENCLNSQSLLPLNAHSADGVEVLTPAHFSW